MNDEPTDKELWTRAKGKTRLEANHKTRFALIDAVSKNWLILSDKKTTTNAALQKIATDLRKAGVGIASGHPVSRRHAVSG